ncbi:5877_t:CDS:1, partial [Dentiscutata erythropus]
MSEESFDLNTLYRELGRIDKEIDVEKLLKRIIKIEKREIQER